MPTAARPVSFATCISALTREDFILRSEVLTLPTRDLQLASLPALIRYTNGALTTLNKARTQWRTHGFGTSFQIVRDLDDLISEHEAIVSSAEKKNLDELPALQRKVQLSLAQYALDTDKYPHLCGS